MRLTVPTSDKHSEVKISVVDSNGVVLSSESVDARHKTVEISDAHWNDDSLSITSQFIAGSGRPDPHCPVEFLKKAKPYEEAPQETPDEVPNQEGCASEPPPTEPSDSGSGDSQDHVSATVSVSETDEHEGIGRTVDDLAGIEPAAGNEPTVDVTPPAVEPAVEPAAEPAPPKPFTPVKTSMTGLPRRTNKF